MKYLNVLDKLTDEELFILSLEKDKKKCATKRALLAQQLIWERANCPFQSQAHYERDHQLARKF